MIKIDNAKSGIDYNNEETLLYQQETRQRLINDLEELDYFLKQRLSELSSKDYSSFSLIYNPSSSSSTSAAITTLLTDCDTLVFTRDSLALIERVNGLLNGKDTLNLLLLRAKPRVAAQRTVAKLMNYPRSAEKYREQTTGAEKKEKEMVKEIESVRK